MNIKFQSPTVTIVECEPCIRSIYHTNGKIYRLSFPYTIFIARHAWITTLSFFLSKRPIKSFDDTIFTVRFPNVSLGGLVCMNLPMRVLEPNRFVELVIGNFWQSKFSYIIGRKHSEGARVLKYWADNTAKNPKYCPRSQTSKSLASCLLQGDFNPTINKLDKI